MRTLVGAGIAAVVVGTLAFVAFGAPVTATPQAPTNDTTTTTEPATTSTSAPTGPGTTTTTAPPTTTTTTTAPPPETAVLSQYYQLPFLSTPSSPGSPTLEASPPADRSSEPPPTTTTAPPAAAPTTTTLPPGRFVRTRDRIVVTGVVLEAPPAVLGPRGAFARAYGLSGGLDGVVSAHGTETVDYTTDTFAQLSGVSRFDGSLRSVGDTRLTFSTTIPRDTSFAGAEPATESGRVLGLNGWRGTIALRYTVSETGNSRGTYRAVFTRSAR